MPFGLPVRLDGVKPLREQAELSLWFPLLMRFAAALCIATCSQLFYCRIDTHGCALLPCDCDIMWLGKTRRNRKLPSKLSNGNSAASIGMEGASATPFAAGCPLPQCKSTSPHLVIRLVLLRPPREFRRFSGLSVHRGYSAVFARPRARNSPVLFSQLHFTWPTGRVSVDSVRLDAVDASRERDSGHR